MPEEKKPEPLVLVENLDGVRYLTLNRPEKRNAFHVDLTLAVSRALTEAREAESVRVTVLRGAGEGFSSGADLNTFLAVSRGETEGIEAIGELGCHLWDFPKPILAAVHGAAVGMGATLLPHFDLVYASSDATFTIPFTRLGLTPEFGSTYTLPRLIGRQRANEMIFSARPVDAATAESWGLVTRVFPREELASRVAEIARCIADRPPEAVAECKRLIRLGEASAREEAVRRESEALATRYGSDENAASAAALLASRR